MSAIHPTYSGILRTALLLAGLALFLAAEAHAQIGSPRLLLLGSNNIRLAIQPDASGAGSAEDDGTLAIWWGTSGTSKMTVSAFAPQETATLTVTAEGVTRGVSTGPVRLVDGMAPADLIVNIPGRGIGFAGFRYRAEVTAESGLPANGTESRTITYTITAQ